MNKKEQIEQDINTMTSTIETLQKAIEAKKKDLVDIEPVKKLTFEDIYPARKHTFYCIDLFGGIAQNHEDIGRSSETDSWIRRLYKNRNYFHTKKDAEKLKWLSPLQREWALILRYLHGGEWWEPEFSNRYECVWEVWLSYVINDIDYTYLNTAQYLPNVMYAKSEEIAKQAVEIMSKERVIAMIKGEYAND